MHEDAKKCIWLRYVSCLEIWGAKQKATPRHLNFQEQRTHSPPPDPARGRRDPVATGEEQDGHTYTYRSDNQLPFRLNFSSYSATPLQTISGWWV